MSTQRPTQHQFRVLSMNFSHGGLSDADGRPDDRFDGLAGIVAEEKPDVVLGQELRGWDEHNRQAVARWERATGLRLAGGLTRGRSKMAIGVFFNPNACHWEQWETSYSAELHHGLGVVVLDVGTELPLTVVSAHLTPYTTAGAAVEAQILTARLYRYKGVGLLGGDINHFPLDDHAPDPMAIPPYNRSSRWLPDGDGTYRPNRAVGQTLSAGGLTDAAHHLYGHREDERLLAATGKGGVRVDQFWLTPALRPALVDYRSYFHDYSDHAAIVADLDLAKIDSDRAWREWV